MSELFSIKLGTEYLYEFDENSFSWVTDKKAAWVMSKYYAEAKLRQVRKKYPDAELERV